MDPVTLGITVGTIGATLASIQQAKGQAAAAKAEAQSIAEQSAFNEQQYRRKAQMAIGQQIATGAASGSDISGGSPLFMELDSIRQAELEALNIRQQGKFGIASKQFETQMANRKIPGLIAGGMSQLASTVAPLSILRDWMTPSNPYSAISSWSAGRNAPWR